VDERCRDTFPVRFDGAGQARIQYLATATVGDVRCTASAACAVVLRGEKGATPALVYTVFGPSAPRPGRVRLEPAASLRDGQVVQVAMEGYPASSNVRVMLCAAPATAGDEACGSPGSSVDVSTDGEGRAASAFTVRAGRVGRSQRPCGRGAYCGLVAVAADGPMTAAVAPISFSAGAGAGYNTARLVPGLGLAIVFGVAVVWLIRRTDWSAPSEAATPELDALS
jgi:hypothetical protein